MNLHEYQAKQLFLKYELPVPKGITARSVEEAVYATSQLTTEQWVVKAQIHGGGRGKAGGVKRAGSKQALEDAARGLLHTQLITYQTNEKGQPINEVLVEEICDIERELYLGAVIDRTSKRIVLMASTEGGVDIEHIATEFPDKIIKMSIDPLVGVMPYQCRQLALALELNANQSKQLSKIMMGIGKMFVACDLSLLEINPLVVTKAGDLLCLDGKVVVDDNALYRQDDLRNMRDAAQEDARELRAREWELNYIALDGDIGCMVNGAGLAMATMDLIKLQGGNPANFLDVGGGATQQRVQEAFKIILSEPRVKAILVNIFGGIVRCDLIAEGIIAAVAEVGIKVPVVVRLEGNRAIEARALLAQNGVNLIPVQSLTEAAERVVQAVRNPL
jgi:succinyl-CoA synthetase beta subunit